MNVSRAASVEDPRRIARSRLPRAVFDFVDGAACDARSARANVEDWAPERFVPRFLRDVPAPSTATTLLGAPAAAPIAIAPAGLATLVHPDADRVLAREAAAAGLPFTLSTAAGTALERVAAVGPGRRWFQLYVFRDRSITERPIERAQAAGYEALVLTVDVPWVGKRDRDRRNGFTVPLRLSPSSALDFALHPRWCLGLARHGTARHADDAQRRARRPRRALARRGGGLAVRPGPHLGGARLAPRALARAAAGQGHAGARRRAARGRRGRRRGGRVEPRRPRDRRTAGDWRLTRHAARSRWTLGAVHSDERDYRSRAPSFSASVDDEAANTTWTLSSGIANDRLEPVAGRSGAGTRRAADVLASVTRVASPVDLVQVALCAARYTGDPSDPYKALDRRPDDRTQGVVQLRWNHHVDGGALDGSTFRTSYRHYRDDWGVRAYTASFERVRPLPGGGSVAPLARFHIGPIAQRASSALTSSRTNAQSSPRCTGLPARCPHADSMMASRPSAMQGRSAALSCQRKQRSVRDGISSTRASSAPPISSATRASSGGSASRVAGSARSSASVATTSRLGSGAGASSASSTRPTRSKGAASFANPPTAS
jgi:hypothetical protein